MSLKRLKVASLILPLDSAHQGQVVDLGALQW